MRRCLSPMDRVLRSGTKQLASKTASTDLVLSHVGVGKGKPVTATNPAVLFEVGIPTARSPHETRPSNESLKGSPTHHPHRLRPEPPARNNRPRRHPRPEDTPRESLGEARPLRTVRAHDCAAGVVPMIGGTPRDYLLAALSGVLAAVAVILLVEFVLAEPHQHPPAHAQLHERFY